MILYKYFQPNEFAFKSLAVGGLWCHYPKVMNDPFECLGLVERKFTKEKLESLREHLKSSDQKSATKLISLNDEKLTILINKFRARKIENFAFCALSETYDNILLWSHYANGHRGFVVGFDFSGFENDYHIRKVRYLDKLDDLDLIKWTHAVLNQSNDYVGYMLDDISVKSKEWSYEGEWRIWRNSPGYYKFGPNKIRCIYFGINCDIETKSILEGLTSYVKEEFPFYEMEFDSDKIKLKW